MIFHAGHSDTFLDSLMTGGGVPSDADLKEISGILHENGVSVYDTAEGRGTSEGEKRPLLDIRALFDTAKKAMDLARARSVWRRRCGV